MLTDAELETIQSRTNQASPPPWHLRSISVVNNQLRIDGIWDESYDEANFVFITHSRTDIVELLNDIKEYKKQIAENNRYLALREAENFILLDELKKLRERLAG